MRIVVVMMACCLLWACSQAELKGRRGRAAEYFKDDRTGLCFAIIDEGILDQRVLGFTNVPCDAVKRMLP